MRWFRPAAALLAACLLCLSPARTVSGAGTFSASLPVAPMAVLTPKGGAALHTGGGASVDVTNAAEGYVICSYRGSAAKARVQITRAGGTTYTYTLSAGGQSAVLPLTAGDGSYTVNVYEHVDGDRYALAHGVTVPVTLRDSRLPFLYPNQYVNFSADSQTVKKAAELTRSAGRDLAKVEAVYGYVIQNISYDAAKAASVQPGYLPAVDQILSSGKGICFDYAAVMAAMLRSQGIPTQLRVGYAGNVYHAWLSVYLTDQGWVNGLIYFDGKSWVLMDPTFAAGAGESEEIMQFIGNGSNYSALYTY